MAIKIDINFDDVYKTLELDGERDKNSFLFISKINQLFNKLHTSNGASVYLFGAGAGGRALIMSGMLNGFLSGILDNDERKWGAQLNGLTVFSPQELKNNKTALILVLSDWYDDIKIQLNKIGILEENIINIMPIYCAYQWLIETSPIEFYISSYQGL
ncbi:hypothetical protein [Aeromonas dhakensis]|uniref:hypothetical protein n=1 Tax=Aeromonas dhakensis TaxID=196024 RepID=UPI001119AF13|nr:hypothetical protein [Aeromonas dhakensis]